MAFETQKIQEFLDELASDSPAPGGGSVAALCAAMGAALVSMVANLTVGKEKYRENWAEMEQTLARSELLRARFICLMNDDTESFNGFMAAMRMPKDTDEEKAARRAAMENASRAATEVPLATLECCVELAEMANDAMRLGNPNTASDAGSAALLALAAGKAAAYNVRINLPGIKDALFTLGVRDRMACALDTLARMSRMTEEGMNGILG